jgi:hypothetical protein
LYLLLRDTLPYLFAFYLIDGLLLAEAGQLVFVRAWRTWRARRGGPQLAAPWPFSEAVRAYDPPLLVTPAGVHVARRGSWHPVPSTEDLTFHAFENGAVARRDGRKVLYGRKAILKAPSEAAAAHVVALLSALAGTEPDRRMTALERWLKASGDLGKIRECRDRGAQGARPRRVVASLLFASLFVAVPALLLLGPEAAGSRLEVAVLATLTLHVVAVVLTRRGLRRTEHAAPTSALASIALFPPNAMHASFVITKDLYAAFDPMAVAAVLLPADAFYDLARRERHRLEVALAGAQGGDTAGYWRVRLDALDRIASAAKADVKGLAAPPPRADEDAVAYCPLCFAEYRPGFDACADCGAALRGFSAS